MRLVGYILLFIGVAGVGFVLVYAFVGGGTRDFEPESEEEFIASVLENAARNPSGPDSQALLPPAGPGEFNLPVIEVETNDYDMGLIANDAIARGEVWVYNRGTAPLNISRVTTSCGCTQGQMATDEIAPGAKAIMRVTVNPLRISTGFTSTKLLTIFSNDPNNSSVEVLVSVLVDPEFVLDPPEFDFGDVPRGQGAKQSLIVRQAKSDIFEITGSHLVASTNVFDYRLEERPSSEWKSPDHREYLVVVEVLPSARMGSHSSQIALTTNLKRIKKYSIPIRAHVKGAYALNPQIVTLRSVHRGETREGVLTITSEVPIKITAIDAPNGDLEVAFRAGDEPNTIVFDVTIGLEPEQQLLKDVWKISVEAEGVVYTEEVSVLAILESKSTSAQSTASAAKDAGGGRMKTPVPRGGNTEALEPRRSKRQPPREDLEGLRNTAPPSKPQ